MVVTTNSKVRRKEKEKMEISNSTEDRISQLPDSLILHILSFLDDTRHVINTTSLLSNRWRPLWKSLSNLHFYDMMFYSSETEWISRFIRFVDTVLLLRDPFDIKKIHLCCTYSEWETQTTHIYTWILVAVRRNVQELTIRLPEEFNFHFPPSLFTSTSLMYLSLSSMDGYISYLTLYPMDLPKLKDLRLCGLLIDQNLTNKIFSGSPSLETLVLDDCCIIDSDMDFYIYSPNLKHLTLERIKSLEETEVIIVIVYAPQLRFFSCKGYIEQEYNLDNVDCLETADIEMELNESEALEDFSLKESYAQSLMDFLRALRNIKDLKLSAGFLEAMMGVPDLVYSPPIQFRNLRRFKMDTWLSGASFRAITYVLQVSPNIEYLSLKVYGVEGDDLHFPYVDEITWRLENNVEYWEVGSSLSCILYHLKFVKIEGLSGCVNELKFLEILLKNSVVLQKLELFSSLPKSSVTEKRMKKFSEMVLSFPRASEAANDMFQFRF